MDYEAKLSDIIASLPEIEGGFLFSPDNGIYANMASGIAGDEGLLQVALKFSKISSLLSVHFQDTGNFRATFKDLILFGMLVEKNHWLFLFYQPTLSPGMLNMTVKLALNIEESETETAVSEPEPAHEAAGKSILPILLDPESELSEPLNTIKDALARYIGPVAELVFEETAEDWGNNFPPIHENLHELISVLENEIDDDDDREAFKGALKPFLA